MTVAMPSTPANYFHLLRRHALDGIHRPLIVFTPKSMLRNKAAVSDVRGLHRGEVPVDPGGAHLRGRRSATAIKVKRVLLTSGKIYYELVARKNKEQRDDVAIVRIEQLYPLPRRRLNDTLEQYPERRAVLLGAGEPANQGAWPTFGLTLPELLPEKLDRHQAHLAPCDVGAVVRGSSKVHAVEQQEIIDEGVRADFSRACVSAPRHSGLGERSSCTLVALEAEQPQRHGRLTVGDRGDRARAERRDRPEAGEHGGRSSDGRWCRRPARRHRRRPVPPLGQHRRTRPARRDRVGRVDPLRCGCVEGAQGSPGGVGLRRRRAEQAGGERQRAAAVTMNRIASCWEIGPRGQADRGAQVHHRPGTRCGSPWRPRSSPMMVAGPDRLDTSGSRLESMTIEQPVRHGGVRMEGFAGKVAVVTGAGVGHRAGAGRRAGALGRQAGDQRCRHLETDLAVTEERLKAIAVVPVKSRTRLDVTEREGLRAVRGVGEANFAGKVNQIYNNAGIAFSRRRRRSPPTRTSSG